MAVFFDAVGGSGLFNSPFISSPTAVAQWKHPAGSGSQRAVVVPLVYAVDGGHIADLTRACSFNGTPMTSLGAPAAWNGTASAWIEFFGLLQVPAVAGKIVATVSGDLLAGRSLRGTSTSYSGVSDFGTYTSATGAGTALAVSGTGPLASMVVGAFGTRDGLSGFTQSLRFGSNSTIALLVGDAAGTASTSPFAATRATANGWAGATVVLNAADVTLTGSPIEADPSISPVGVRRLPRPGTNRRVVFNLTPDAY